MANGRNRGQGNLSEDLGGIVLQESATLPCISFHTFEEIHKASRLTKPLFRTSLKTTPISLSLPYTDAQSKYRYPASIAFLTVKATVCGETASEPNVPRPMPGILLPALRFMLGTEFESMCFCVLVNLFIRLFSGFESLTVIFLDDGVIPQERFFNNYVAGLYCFRVCY